MGGLEQVALGADRCFDLRYQRFADRIQRRIGHLREELHEVVIEQARLVRQHRQRRIVAHGTHGFLALLRHGRHEDAQIFVGVSEGLLTLQHGGVIRLGHVRRLGKLIERHQVRSQPFLVWMHANIALLKLGIVNDAAFACVHEKDASGMQALFDEHVLRRDIEHTDLGCHDH